MEQMTSHSKAATTRFTEAAGLSMAPLSVEPYRSPEFFEREREQIFKRAWLAMGRIEQLPGPDSYIVKEVEVCKASVLITRDAEDKIRAFHNVCSHRGNRVALVESGKGARFSCNYHGWTYRNDGQLVGVPDEANFHGLDKRKCGLTPVAVDVWEGWIFINFSPAPEVTLEAFLGEFGRLYRGIPYLNAHRSILFEAKFDANWKVIADGFAETYHIPKIHPKTIRPTFSNRENPHSRPISVRTWGPHRLMSSYGNPDYAPPENALVERLAHSHIVTGNVLSAASLEAMTDLLKHPAVNPTKAKAWSVDVNWIFPNFHIDISPGGFWTHQFWPTSHNTVRWEATFYIPEAANFRERLQQEHYAARLAEILLEDVSNTQRQQLGLESGAKDVMYLKDDELMIRHSLHHVHKWIDAATVAEALS